MKTSTCLAIRVLCRIDRRLSLQVITALEGSGLCIWNALCVHTANNVVAAVAISRGTHARGILLEDILVVWLTTTAIVLVSVRRDLAFSQGAMHHHCSRRHVLFPVFAPQVHLGMLVKHVHFDTAAAAICLCIEGAIAAADEHSHSSPIAIAILPDSSWIVSLRLMLKGMDARGTAVSWSVMAVVILVFLTRLREIALVIILVPIHDTGHLSRTLRNELCV